MSLKGTISFGAYIPPAPKSISFKTSDLKREYETETGDIMSYIIRKNVLEISCSFEATATQANDIKTALSANEITVAYRKDGFTSTAYMATTSYSSKCITITGKEHYDISVTLKEIRR